MEGLATKLAFAAPLQAWKPTAPALPARKLPLFVGKSQPQYPLSLPCRTFYPGRPQLSQISLCHSNSKQNMNDEEETGLKSSLARAGGLVASVAMAILSLQGFFCRPALAARSWSSTPTSTSTPDFDSVRKEEITELFEEILQPQQEERSGSSNPSPDLGPLPDRDELLKGFRRLPPEFQKEVVKRSLMAPLVAGNIEMAIEMSDSLIEERPNDVEWKLMKAYILDEADRDAEAKLTFEQILQQEPYNAHALQGLAIVMHKFGEDAAMIKILEELVKKAQEHERGGVAYNMKLVLAHVYIVQDNLEGALKQYQNLIDENPQDFRPYLCQGIIYTVLDKKDEARERFEKYSKLVPDSFSSQQEFLGEVMLKVLNEAEKLSQKRKKEQKLLEEGTSPDEAKQSGKPMNQPRFR